MLPGDIVAIESIRFEVQNILDVGGIQAKRLLYHALHEGFEHANPKRPTQQR